MFSEKKYHVCFHSTNLIPHMNIFFLKGTKQRMLQKIRNGNVMEEGFIQGLHFEVLHSVLLLIYNTSNSSLTLVLS